MTNTLSPSWYALIAPHDGYQPLSVHESQSEEFFKNEVIRYAQQQGWLVSHILPSHRGGMLRTQQQGDAGFVDLVLARAGDPVICAELKVKRNVPDDNQRAWATALGESYRLWYPSDADHIIELLTGERSTP